MLNLIAGTVKSVLADPLAGYKVNESSAVMAGHKQLFRVMEATERETSNPASVFTCSIPALEARCGSPAEVQLTLKKVKDAVALLTRMRHPSLIRVILPLTEDKGKKRLVFVTERVECVVGTQLNDSLVSRQEVLLGLYQCGEALEFLHTKGGVLLANFSPASLFITPGGNWKIGDLMHAVLWQQQASGFKDDSNSPQTLLTESITRFTFHSPSSPDLDFFAPEMVEFATKNTGSGGITVDLFGAMQSPSTPLFPDSDTFSFLATCALLLDKKKLFTSGDEPSVYRRQLGDADEFVRRVYPSWMPQGVSCVPRVSLMSLIESDSFASVDIRLLVELAGFVSLEPRRKLQLLKGLHDELSRNSFAEKMIVIKIAPLLLSESREERMYRFILPIVLEASNALSPAAFESSLLRAYVLSVIQSCNQAPVTSEKSSLEILLQQLLEKFERFYSHFSSAKDLNTIVLGMIVRSVQISSASNAQQVALATVGLQALNFLLRKFERPFATGDVLVSALLQLLLVLPAHSTAVVDCVVKLLPWTTRDVREAELEPKLIAGLKELSGKESSSSDTERIMELLFSIVAESSIDHVATVTLPLLCPLLVIGNQALRATVSQYVSRLVSMVTQKKTDQERHEVLRDQQARLAFASTPSTTGPSQGSKVSNIHPVSVSARHADVDANVSFFSSSLYSTGSAAPAADASVTARRSVSTDDDLRTAFGF